MTDPKNTSVLQSSPRGKFAYNMNSSMSHNASAIQEDDNLIKERNSAKTGAVLSESRFKPSSLKEERPKKYSLQHDIIPLFTSSFRGKLSAHLRSRIAALTIIGLIFLFMLLVFINILLDDSLEDDPAIRDAIRAINYAQLGILAIFILEISFKIYAFGFKGYFKDAWGIVDCLLVLATFGLVIADIQLEDVGFNGMTRVRGVFKLFRVFVVIRKACAISKISNTRHRTSSLTFKSPVEKIIDLLEMLKGRAKDNTLIEDLDWAIEIITTNQLYEPIIDDGKGDKNEVGAWVKSYGTQIREDKKKPEFLRRSSIMPAAVVPVKQPNFEIPNEAREILKRDIDQLHFDVMEFKNLSGGEELAFTSLWLFERHNFFELLNIKQETFIKFIRKVQAGYLPNPYHNATHAADVLQSTNYFLTTGELLAKAEFNNLEVAAMFLSSAIHDYDHPGTNNAFHMNTSSVYAIRYNDKAILENHHVSAIFDILQNESYNIFANFTKEDYKVIRERIIALVLATDMSTHFSDIAKLKGRLAADFDIKDKDKKFAMEIIVHTADISNPSKPWDLCREWTNRVVTEFWDQGDKERDLGLPITYLCDRYTVNLAKSQLGFIDFVVSPLLVLVKEILPKVDISHLETNKNKWKELVDFYEQDLKNINEKRKTTELKEIAA